MENRQKLILNENQFKNLIKEIVVESVKNVINEMNNITAMNAYAKALKKYKEIPDKQSPEAKKLERQLKTFLSYTNFDFLVSPTDKDDIFGKVDVQNQYGNTFKKFVNDVGSAYGKEFRPSQVALGGYRSLQGKDGTNIPIQTDKGKSQYDDFRSLPIVGGTRFNSNWANKYNPHYSDNELVFDADEADLEYNKGEGWKQKKR